MEATDMRGTAGIGIVDDGRNNRFVLAGEIRRYQGGRTKAQCVGLNPSVLRFEQLNDH